jgi:hypothetical protein
MTFIVFLSAQFPRCNRIFQVDKKHLSDAPITVLFKIAHFNPQRYEKFALLLPRWLGSVLPTNFCWAMNTKDLGHTHGLGSANLIFITLVLAKKKS